MRHSYFGRKLSRNYDERKGLLRLLTRSLVSEGSIRTTLAKAKAVQPMVERLVTQAKKADDRAKRAVFQVLGDKKSTELLMADATTRFAARTSGYTRIIKLGQRQGDAAEEALLSFVDARVTAEVIAPKKTAAAPVKKEVKPEVKKAVRAKSKPVKKAAGPAKKKTAARKAAK